MCTCTRKHEHIIQKWHITNHICIVPRRKKIRVILYFKQILAQNRSLQHRCLLSKWLRTRFPLFLSRELALVHLGKPANCSHSDLWNYGGRHAQIREDQNLIVSVWVTLLVAVTNYMTESRIYVLSWFKGVTPNNGEVWLQGHEVSRFYRSRRDQTGNGFRTQAPFCSPETNFHPLDLQCLKFL